MNYWLLKSEPETFSWDDLVKQKTASWDGVRNYQARNHLRNMKTGENALFYYSGKNPRVVGIVEIVKSFYPDPTAKEGDWSAVDVKPIEILKREIFLKEIKQNPDLKNMVLLKNSRLSVQPVTKDEFQTIIDISNQ